MKLIKPSEISARIYTLLDESDERVVIVSPYMNISKWFKFLKKLNELKTRNITPDIYVRDDPDNLTTFRDLDRLGLAYTRIPNLHCKLYMNEKSGIVTSMNLLLTSEINSLEIGYATETEGDFNELQGFYYRYLQRSGSISEVSSLPATAAIKQVLNQIRVALDKTSRNSWLWLSANRLEICTGVNHYVITIHEGYLRIRAYLKIDPHMKQHAVAYASSLINKIKDLTSLNVQMHPEKESMVIHLSGQAHRKLKSYGIHGLLQTEKSFMIKSVVQFIDAAEEPVYP